MKHTLNELYQMQALPLNLKIRLTEDRIRGWLDSYDAYVSFSGGKDSTVLLDIARKIDPSIPAVFCDTGLEYPEIREFVKTFDNVEIIRPKMNFRKVIETYGYPFISKEVSERVYYAQKYLTWWDEQGNIDRPTDRPTYSILQFMGVRGKDFQKIKETIFSKEVVEFLKTGNVPLRLRQMFGREIHEGEQSQFTYRQWMFLCNSPFWISNKCCDVMKKSPFKSYERRTNRKPITATMASESRVRTQKWLQNGCNAFDSKKKISNPMAFWTEQDVLLYIYQHHTRIAEVYGEVVKEQEVEGQLDIEDLGIFDLERPLLKTTGCSRTGCMFCGFGCHLDKKGKGRFEMMKQTHPKQYEWIMKPWEEGGLGYKEVIDWLNEHGNLNIRY